MITGFGQWRWQRFLSRSHSGAWSLLSNIDWAGRDASVHCTVDLGFLAVFLRSTEQDRSHPFAKLEILTSSDEF